MCPPTPKAHGALKNRLNRVNKVSSGLLLSITFFRISSIIHKKVLSKSEPQSSIAIK